LKTLNERDSGTLGKDIEQYGHTVTYRVSASAAGADHSIRIGPDKSSVTHRTCQQAQSGVVDDRHLFQV